MDQRDREKRLHQLVRSPGGRALLILIEQNANALTDVVKVPQALHLVSSAVGQLNRWASDRDAKMAMIASWGERSGNLASRLIDTPGIQGWWGSMVLDRQVWIQPAKDSGFPAAEFFPTPTAPPDHADFYAQRKYNRFSTLSEFAGATSQLAEIVSGETDWWIDDYVAARRRLLVNPDARVVEIDSAEDWHAFVAQHGAQSTTGSIPDPNGLHGLPWANNDGLVPDWASAATVWDGVHVSLWAFLTAMQVRIESAAGWTESWTWGGEETTWLRWSFDSVEEMSPIQASPNEELFDHDWRKGADTLPVDPRWWSILRPGS